jgi:parvulin-like peptidyl-prolyl isomerase
MPLRCLFPPGILCAALLLGAADPVSASGEALTAPPQGAHDSKVLVVVNGEPITEAQVLRRLKAVDPDVEVHRETPNRWSRLMESATEAEIRDRLLLQAARADGLEVSQGDLSGQLARSREILGEDRFAEMLARRGASDADYRAFLRDRMLIDKYRSMLFADLDIDDATLRDYYRGHKESFRAPARVWLEAVELADAGLAQRVAERLRGGEKLTALADAGAGVRTREGWVLERDLPAKVRELVDAAAAGDVLGPIDAGGETRVIRVRERQASRLLSYQESRDLIRERLTENRVQAVLDAWYEGARGGATIEYP